MLIRRSCTTRPLVALRPASAPLVAARAGLDWRETARLARIAKKGSDPFSRRGHRRTSKGIAGKRGLTPFRADSESRFLV
jgi:hypothetical protein